jgi:hypothetical protein
MARAPLRRVHVVPGARRDRHQARPAAACFRAGSALAPNHELRRREHRVPLPARCARLPRRLGLGSGRVRASAPHGGPGPSRPRCCRPTPRVPGRPAGRGAARRHPRLALDARRGAGLEGALGAAALRDDGLREGEPAHGPDLVRVALPLALRPAAPHAPDRAGLVRDGLLHAERRGRELLLHVAAGGLRQRVAGRPAPRREQRGRSRASRPSRPTPVSPITSPTSTASASSS